LNEKHLHPKIVWHGVHSFQGLQELYCPCLLKSIINCNSYITLPRDARYQIFQGQSQGTYNYIAAAAGVAKVHPAPRTLACGSLSFPKKIVFVYHFLFLLQNAEIL